MCVCLFFFFKQKTAYEMRISDWSSDVCSSDLVEGRAERGGETAPDPARPARALSGRRPRRVDPGGSDRRGPGLPWNGARRLAPRKRQDRKSVVEGKSVSVRVDFGGRRIIKNKRDKHTHKPI